MRPLMLCSLTLSLALGLSGCQSIDGLLKSSDAKSTQVQSADVGVSEKTPVKSTDEQLEQAPDLTGAEILGGLSSDAMGPYDMSTNPEAVRQGVALSDRLESAPQAKNALLGAVESYSGVNEVQLEGNLDAQVPVIDVMSGAAPAPQGALESQESTPHYVLPEIESPSSCSTELNLEANGQARALIKEIAARLRNESGSIYVAPTIIDNEYQDCVGNLAHAIEDGLVGSNTFQIVPATTNLNNIISQNIGSSTILPSLIHQCRASGIPYLVVSQVKKTGDKAALTLRIIRTEDGITLSQTYRRLHH